MADFIRNERGRLCIKHVGDDAPVELVDGPWHAEPDRVEFRHEGIACLALRGPAGSWCGYVAIPAGHPWRAERPLRLPDGLPEITYISPCKGDVCHAPLPGESDDVLWFGFDYAHCGRSDDPDFVLKDADPEALERRRHFYIAFGWGEPEPVRGTYRDIAYVTQQIRDVAQKARIAQGG